jgi:hypothetical protein
MIEKQTYFRLEKYDAFSGVASGVLCAEEVDRDHELLDYNASKPYFQQWSNSVNKDSRGLSWGNCRLQHNPERPVGRVIEPLQFDDANKRIRCTVEIAEQEARDMLEKGILTGFSIGGQYVSKTPLSNGVTRYVANPSEISVVDRPCIPNATFDLVKRDGTSERRRLVGKMETRNIDESGTIIEHLGNIAKSLDHLAKVHDRMHKAHDTMAAACKAHFAALDKARKVEEAGQLSKADKNALHELGLIAKAAHESARLTRLDDREAHKQHREAVAKAVDAITKLAGVTLGGPGQAIANPASSGPESGFKAENANLRTDPFAVLAKLVEEAHVRKLAKGLPTRVNPNALANPHLTGGARQDEVRGATHKSFFERQVDRALGK